MGLETGTYPSDLVVTNPIAGDPKSQGDDHLRLIKTVTKNFAALPAFAAYKNASQSLTTGTPTKVEINTEEFDTATCFDTATYRFTPNVAGYYSVSGIVRATVTDGTLFIAAIYKNGTLYTRGEEKAFTTGITGTQQVVVHELISMNGTTDYVELFATVSGTGPTLPAAAANLSSRFSAFCARPA